MLLAPLLLLSASLDAVASDVGESGYERNWEVHFLDEYPDAVCNDGTPAAYYFRPGVGWASRRWMVFLEGGGWCWDKGSCAQRWATMHSTSSTFARDPATVKEWSKRLSHGIFSTDPRESALSDARSVYVRMCSNDGYMGNRKDGPNGWQYRGQKILEAVFTDLQKRTGLGASSKDLVVFAGCSSGARGAMVALDYIATYHVGKATLVGVLDSPFWVPIEPIGKWVTSFEDQTRSVYENFNATGFINRDCAATFPGEPWKCLFAAFAIPYVRSRYLLYASQYDNFGISTNLHPGYDPNPNLNLEQRHFAEKYRNLVLKYLPQPSAQSGQSVWSSACYTHCLISHPDAKFRYVQGISIPEMLARWLAAPSLAAASVVVRDECEGFNCGAHHPSKPDGQGMLLIT